MRQSPAGKILLYAVLWAGALLSVFPFYWMFVMGSNPNSAVNKFPPVFVPGGEFMNNFNKALSEIRFWPSLGNSLFVAATVTVGVLFFCSLAGFAFAKFQFPGKNFLFFLLLATLAVPPQLNLIPSYTIIVKLGLLDTLAALIVPGVVNAFGIFWMRQYISSAVHDELLEAARIDGCRNFRMYWNIVVPIILPAFATLGIVTFLNVYNDFVWPLVVLKTDTNFTVQITLNQLFSNPQNREYSKILAATWVATLPLILAFLFFRRYFIEGLTSGSVKS